MKRNAKLLMIVKQGKIPPIGTKISWPVGDSLRPRGSRPLQAGSVP